jgi:hypothetical protein
MYHATSIKNLLAIIKAFVCLMIILMNVNYPCYIYLKYRIISFESRKYLKDYAIKTLRHYEK